MIDRSTDIKAALRSRQRGFLLNPFRFVSPQPIDPHFANVSLRLDFEGTDGSTTIKDRSLLPKTVYCLYDAKLTTAQKKFGNSSAVFDGSGDFISVSSAADLQLGTDDATVEFQMYPRSLSGTAIVLCKHVSANGSWIIFRNGSTLQLYVSSNGSSWDMAGGITIGTLAINTWQHVAWSRQDSMFHTFLEGTPGSTSTSASSIYAGSEAVVIGANASGGDFYDGYIDDLRITKGVCRYSSAFTPPTESLPIIGP